MKQIELETQLSALDADYSFDRTVIENKIRDRRFKILHRQRAYDDEIATLKGEILLLEKELSLAKDKYIQKKNELYKMFSE